MGSIDGTHILQQKNGKIDSWTVAACIHNN
jgi:hypothetical protein